MAKLCFFFSLVDNRGKNITQCWNFDDDLPFRQKTGDFRLRCEIPKIRLYKGRYTIQTSLADTRGIVDIETVREICPFEIIMSGYMRKAYDWWEDMADYLEDFTWEPVKPA